MNSAFNPQTGAWEIGWPGRVSKHDLVYLSPPTDPMQGIPIGNGDLGALLWCEGSRIIIALNKCDLWDDTKAGRFHNWAPDEEDKSTTLRHAGRVIIDLGLPLLDLFYLEEFEGRLELAQARIKIAAATPFGQLRLTAFIDANSGLLVLSCTTNLKEKVAQRIVLERWGSRTFSHWYSQVNRDPSLGLGGTDVSVGDGRIVLTQRLSSGSFALAGELVAEKGINVEPRRLHSRAGEFLVESDTTKKEWTLFLGVTSPRRKANPAAAASGMLDGAMSKGEKGLFSQHREFWKEFWSRSYLNISDDYLENLWYLTLYYAGCSNRGKSPGLFINGLWGWNRDVRNWNFYFHWNQQEIYWPLNAAGHHDLVNSYLEYRFASLPHGRKDAQELFGAEGAVVSDVCDRRGYNSLGELLNHTPVAQIAMDFWRQYRFTGSRDFLNKRALPYILEAAYFFESLFERAEDGRYHAKEGTGYEGWIKLRDCISELVYARVLFLTAIAALAEAHIEEPRSAKWQEIADHLSDLPVIEAEESCLGRDEARFRFNRGLFKGETAFSRELLASGFGIEEKRWLSSKIPVDKIQAPPADVYQTIQALEAIDSPYSAIIEDMRVYDGIFPFVEYSAVFPSGLVGLSQRGSELYNAAANTAKLYAPDCMGWDPLPLVLARLGLARELRRILDDWPGRWQFYCNGFGHYGPRDIMKADGALEFRTALVKDVSLPEGEREKKRFPIPMWFFRHMGMESMSVLASAINEMLVQSHDDIIRIGPALSAEGDAGFTLHAQGGFVVSAEIKSGSVLWVAIKSLNGALCQVENPWPGKKVFLFADGIETGKKDSELFSFATKKNVLYLLSQDKNILREWRVKEKTFTKNNAFKKHPGGAATLGLPRMF